MGPWGGRLERGKPPEATPASGFMLAHRTSPRGGRVRVRGTGVPMWGSPGDTDVPVAGRASVRGHLREGCSWSGDRGSPVLLHFIFLKEPT